MDREEIRYLLGSTIYARAKAYESRVQDLECCLLYTSPRPRDCS